MTAKHLPAELRIKIRDEFIRKSRKVPRGELAAIIGVHRSLINKYENKTRCPSSRVAGIMQLFILGNLKQET
jgi:DNA-binding transcriptional regulator YiaG